MLAFVAAEFMTVSRGGTKKSRINSHFSESVPDVTRWLGPHTKEAAEGRSLATLETAFEPTFELPPLPDLNSDVGKNTSTQWDVPKCSTACCSHAPDGYRLKFVLGLLSYIYVRLQNTT